MYVGTYTHIAPLLVLLSAGDQVPSWQDYLVNAANGPHLAVKALSTRHRRALLFQNACMARNMKGFKLHVFAVLQELVFMQIDHVAATKLKRFRLERGNC